MRKLHFCVCEDVADVINGDNSNSASQKVILTSHVVYIYIYIGSRFD
jgi:hypothetical protein